MTIKKRTTILFIAGIVILAGLISATIYKVRQAQLLIEKQHNIGIESVINEQKENFTVTYVLLISLFFLSISLLLITGYLFNVRILSRIKDMQKVTQNIAQGNLRSKVEFTSADEIGSLSQNINEMSDALMLSRENIENKIASRTEKLNQMNDVLIGRELKMIELKKKIQELEGKIDNENKN